MHLCYCNCWNSRKSPDKFQDCNPHCLGCDSVWTSILFLSCLNHEDGNRNLLRTLGTYLPVYTASHHIGLKFSRAPPWCTEMLQILGLTVPVLVFILNALFRCNTKWTYLSIQCFSNSQRALMFCRFPGFAPVSYLYEQHADKNNYGALVELYWGGGEPKCWGGGEGTWPPNLLPQITHGVTWARSRASEVRGRRPTAWALAQPLQHKYHVCNT